MAYNFNLPFIGNVHQGSWGILPDLGLTERAARKVSSGQTTDLGNAITGSYAQTPPQDGGPTRTDLYSTSRSNTPQQQFSNQLPSQPQQQQQQAQQSSGNFMDYYGGWNQDQAMADFRGAFGGDINRLRQARGFGSTNSNPWENEISNAYGPALSALNDLERMLGQNKTENLSGVGLTYGEGQAAIGNEQKELEGNLSTQNQNLETGLQSALAEAVRYYNGLKQQSMARFGQGSSTGGAVSELAYQEFLRNSGKLQNSFAQGSAQLAQEGVKLQNYISTKLSSLDQWKREAVSRINENFSNQIAQIGARRGEIEVNKTNAKLQALQTAMQNAKNVEAVERDWKQKLGLWAVEQAQKYSSRAFTPQEIMSVYNNMMNAQISPGNQPQLSQAYAPQSSRSTEDELRRQGLII